jgi:hypothetical protein
MDADAFDELTRTLLSRRGIGAAVGAALVALRLPSIADAEDVHAETCTPNGPRCDHRHHRRRSRKHGRHRRSRQHARRGCRRCCSRCTAGTRIGNLRCACCPSGAHCTRDDQCCAGDCQSGFCGGLQPGPMTCPTPSTSVCGPNVESCGPSDANCACFATTAGTNACTANQFVCDADKTTCVDDADCIGAFGAGFTCIATHDCSARCGGNGNACFPPCAAGSS